MENNENKRINYKNIFISYLDKKDNFNEKDIRDFFRNLIKKYDNKINYLIVGKKEKRLNVLLILDKRPHISNIEIFNLVLKEKKSSKATETLEPIQLEKTISPQTTYDDIIAQSEKVCEVGVPSFIQEISSKTRKEQNEEYNDYFIKLKREFDEEKDMTYDTAEKIMFSFLRKTKNYIASERASMVKQSMKINFSRIKKITDSIEIRDLNTFYLDNPQVQFIINHIKTQLQRLRNGHRAIGLIIEGPGGIGKTDLMMAICKELNIPFNYMNRKMNFSRKRYDDEQAEIDIWDDFGPSYFTEKDLLEAILGGQFGFTVETAKHEPDRDIVKRKINIFLCNEQKSFQEYFEQRPADMKYLLSRPNVVFFKLENKLLFKVEKEKETDIEKLIEETFIQEKGEIIPEIKKSYKKKSE